MEHRRAWITASDGTRLAARLWLPEELPAPVVLEALPYRMDDLTATYASEYERLCEEGGLAVCRLDIRGTGSSGGIAVDEYTAEEHGGHLRRDCVARGAGVVERARRDVRRRPGRASTRSRSPACSRPRCRRSRRSTPRTTATPTTSTTWAASLKAVDLVDWVLYMVAGNALPPVPAVVGDGWREEWEHRLEDGEPWLLRWLEEQADGPYWRHGSVRPDYGRIACPTMIVAGWADGYTNIVFRALESLRCPTRVLARPVGPRLAGDRDPRAARRPRPGADPLVPPLARRRAERRRRRAAARRLRPALDAPGPDADGDARRVAERGDTGRRSGSRNASCARRATAPTRSEVRGDVGQAAWISCAGRLPWGLPGDQRRDDALSLCYDWEPLAEELDVMGHPRVRLDGHLGPTRRLPLRAALRRLPGRGLGARRPRRPQPDPPDRARRTDRARAGSADGGGDRAGGDLLGVRARAPRTARARGRRLAEHVAASVRLAAPRRSRLGAARPPCARRPGRPAPAEARPDDRRRRACARHGASPARARLALRGRHRRARVQGRHVVRLRLRRALRRPRVRAVRRRRRRLPGRPCARMGARASRVPDRLARGRRPRRRRRSTSAPMPTRTTSSWTSSRRSRRRTGFARRVERRWERGSSRAARLGRRASALRRGCRPRGAPGRHLRRRAVAGRRRGSAPPPSGNAGGSGSRRARRPGSASRP